MKKNGVKNVKSISVIPEILQSTALGESHLSFFFSAKSIPMMHANPTNSGFQQNLILDYFYCGAKW